MMKPIRIEKGAEATVYACTHWRSFPPAFVQLEESPEDLRARKVLDDASYQRYKVWEVHCGVTEMGEASCLKCPHVRRVEIQPHQTPKMWTLDGKEFVPAIDIPAISAMPQYRRADMREQARISEEQARKGKGK